MVSDEGKFKNEGNTFFGFAHEFNFLIVKSSSDNTKPVSDKTDSNTGFLKSAYNASMMICSFLMSSDFKLNSIFFLKTRDFVSPVEKKAFCALKPTWLRTFHTEHLSR